MYGEREEREAMVCWRESEVVVIIIIVVVNGTLPLVRVEKSCKIRRIGSSRLRGMEGLYHMNPIQFWNA